MKGRRVSLVARLDLLILSANDSMALYSCNFMALIT